MRQLLSFLRCFLLSSALFCIGAQAFYISFSRRYTSQEPQRNIRLLIRRVRENEEESIPRAIVISPNLNNGTSHFRDVILDAKRSGGGQTRKSGAIKTAADLWSRFRFASRELFAYLTWQIGTNVRGDIAGEDLRREVSVRWRQASAIARGETIFTGSSSMNGAGSEISQIRSKSSNRRDVRISVLKDDGSVVEESQESETNEQDLLFGKTSASQQPIEMFFDEIYFGEPTSERDTDEIGADENTIRSQQEVFREDDVWGDMYNPTMTEARIENGFEESLGRDQLQSRATPYLYGSPLDDEHLFLLDKLVAGGSLDWKGAATLLEGPSRQGIPVQIEEEEEEDYNGDTDDRLSFELTDTVIAGKWRSRRRKKGGSSEIYFEKEEGNGG